MTLHTAANSSASTIESIRTSGQQAPAEGVVVRTRLRITRRGRIVLTALAALPLVAGAVFIAVNGGSAIASGSESGVAFDYVTIGSGDSLWGLAEDLAPTTDPRDVVADIVSLNQLATAELEPGQQLAIPARYSH